jgi:hypothetical protein
MEMFPCLVGMDVTNVKTMRRAITHPIKNPHVVYVIHNILGVKILHVF